MPKFLGLAGVSLAFSVTAAAAPVVADPPKACAQCVEWNVPLAPFKVFGDTWYVGTAGLASILITSPNGHVLIDGGLAQSAPLIADNIRTAGFRLEDVKLILNSHTHYDHAGGIAALQRASKARVAASPASKRALEMGGPTGDDPQFNFGHAANDWEPVRNVRPIRDGETLTVGDLEITANFTPGHTPGGTTWTWKSCEGDRCLDMVYVDSLNAISAPGFRFSGEVVRGSRVATFEQSIALVAQLPCDIMLGPHPSFFDMDAKLARLKENPAENPFVDAHACEAYAAGAYQRLQARVAEEMPSTQTPLR